MLCAANQRLLLKIYVVYGELEFPIETVLCARNQHSLPKIFVVCNESVFAAELCCLQRISVAAEL